MPIVTQVHRGDARPGQQPRVVQLVGERQRRPAPRRARGLRLASRCRRRPARRTRKRCLAPVPGSMSAAAGRLLDASGVTRVHRRLDGIGEHLQGLAGACVPRPFGAVQQDRYAVVDARRRVRRRAAQVEQPRPQHRVVVVCSARSTRSPSTGACPASQAASAAATSRASGRTRRRTAPLPVRTRPRRRRVRCAARPVPRRRSSSSARFSSRPGAAAARCQAAPVDVSPLAEPSASARGRRAGGHGAARA